MDITVEEERVAIEAIATLVNVKRVMAELILKPAGVPPTIYGPLLYKIDDITGRPLSKRQMAPLILQATKQHPGASGVPRKIVEIAANWSSYHLAKEELIARGTVQMARKILGTIELMEVQETQRREQERKEELARMERERAELFKRHLQLLLMMFDDMARADNAHRRGYDLQDLLNRTFDLYEVPVHRSFTRNDGAEQIDGAFKLEGWHYLVECRWRKEPADTRQLDGLQGQVDRSGKQTMGLFLSINGWSDHVPTTLKQNSKKSLLLMDGYDLRCVLSGQADLRDFLLSKVAKLNFEGEPFLSATEYLKNQKEE